MCIHLNRESSRIFQAQKQRGRRFLLSDVIDIMSLPSGSLWPAKKSCYVSWSNAVAVHTKEGDGSSETIFRSSLRFMFSKFHASAKLSKDYRGSQGVFMLNALFPAALHKIYQRQLCETTSSFPIPLPVSAYHLQ